MFWSIPPSCGQRSPLQKLTGPFFVWIVLRVRHCFTSAVVASSSSGDSLGSVPCTVFRQSVHAVYAKLPSDVFLGHAFRNGESPGVLDQRAHLVGVDPVETDVDPVVPKVRLARQRELLGLRFDERVAPVLGEGEAHDRSVTREGQIDDPADAKLDATSRERLAAARKRARKSPNLVDRHHGASALRIRAMANLIYSAITSLDGYVADEEGNFDWAAPDEEVHSFVNELERPVGIYLYGRRMYEVMVYWETADTLADQSPPPERDFAEIWQAADKVVYSKTLEQASSARTRIEREFDPEAVRRLTASAERDLSVGGPDLAAQAIKAGLVDELHLFVTPIIVGGGNPWLPDGVRVKLELLDERRFGSGVVYLQYRTRT